MLNLDRLDEFFEVLESCGLRILNFDLNATEIDRISTNFNPATVNNKIFQVLQYFEIIGVTRSYTEVKEEGILIEYTLNITSTDNEALNFMTEKIKWWLQQDFKKDSDSVNILVKPTVKCNMNCKYCYDTPLRNTCKPDMTDETLNKVLDVVSNSTNKVQWIWHGGEPLLMGKEFFLKFNKETLPERGQSIGDFSQSILSNGMLLDKEMREVMKECHIGYGVSYNYGNQAELRGLDKGVDTTLKHIKEITKSYTTGEPPLGVIDVITNKNYKDMIKIYEFYKNMNMRLSFNIGFHTNATDENDLDLDMADFVSEFAKFIEHVYFDKYGTIEREVFTYVGMLLDDKTLVQCRNIDCRNVWVGVEADGRVTPCDRYFGPDAYNIGNIRDFDSVQEIYQSEGYTDYSKEVDERFTNICAKCAVFSLCKGGCNGTAYERNGNCKGVDEDYCAYIKGNLISSYLILRDINDKAALNMELSKVLYTNNYISLSEIEAFLNSGDNKIKIEKASNFVTVDEMVNSLEYKLFKLFNSNSDVSMKFSEIMAKYINPSKETFLYKGVEYSTSEYLVTKDVSEFEDDTEFHAYATKVTLNRIFLVMQDFLESKVL